VRPRRGEAGAAKGLGAGEAIRLVHEAIGLELDVLGELCGEVSLEVASALRTQPAPQRIPHGGL